MTFTESVSTCSKKSLDYNFRASRSEYWWFFLFGTLASMATSHFGYRIGGPDMADSISNAVDGAL